MSFIKSFIEGGKSAWKDVFPEETFIKELKDKIQDTSISDDEIIIILSLCIEQDIAKQVVGKIRNLITESHRTELIKELR